MTGQSIAISGSGIICAIGADKTAVLDSLRRGTTGIGKIAHLESTLTHLPVGEVKFSNDELKSLLGISVSRDISRTSLLGAIALRQALDDAGIAPASLKGRKVALISGTTVGGMDVTERHYKDMATDSNAAAYAARHDCGSNTREIADLCGIDCEAITISTACSSALNAIILGTRMLLSGEADLVLAGGTEALSRFHLNGFNALMILDHEQCRPFDTTRRGLNLGEGAAFVVLERATQAKERGADTEAYIGGYGNRCDAFHQTATSPDGIGAYLAMKDALNMAGVQPSDIDYINAHGTGTPDNDRSESAAVRRLFADSVPPVSSTKSFTGHTTSASGSIETVICLLAMRHGFIPRSLGWSESGDDTLQPSTGSEGIALHNVLCNSFGFGGNDSSLLLSDTAIPLPEIALARAKVAAESMAASDDDLKDIRLYASPMEARRMSKILKGAVLTSMRALGKAGVTVPDAIVIATRYGMLEQGEKILEHLTESGEEGISPTLFMQSTHNTIAGALAIRLKCHGYNITYSQGDDSERLAVEEATRLISEGKAETVLVGVHDQCPPGFAHILALAGMEAPTAISSKSLVIVKD